MQVFVAEKHFEGCAGDAVTEEMRVTIAAEACLSWDDVVRGARDAADGSNFVLHEFAHQLDQEDGESDGAPLLPPTALRTWGRVLGAEYERLREEVAADPRSVLDACGATDRPEFFAVATESFFERPLQLEREHPELYQQLKQFYGQDPARRAVRDRPGTPAPPATPTSS